MRVAIVDGYVDEPACLGVPPYLGPYPRYVAGAVREAGADALAYVTADELRAGKGWDALAESDLAIVIAGAVVPGRYLRGTPLSVGETAEVLGLLQGVTLRARSRGEGGWPVPSAIRSSLRRGRWVILGGPLVAFGLSNLASRLASAGLSLEDVAVARSTHPWTAVFDLLSGRPTSERPATLDEWNRWAIGGAFLAGLHPDHPWPLIAEVETYAGCVRWQTGGCAFCVEPLSGRPVFRSPEAVGHEAAALAAAGVRAIRLGGQTCIVSYMARGLGRTETPEPDPDAVESLLGRVRASAPDLAVLHVDNANPAVIAAHPAPSESVLRSIVAHCTSGNVLALGLESADPAVREANRLNASAEDCLAAVRLINHVGRERGWTGLPRLLPGINLLAGLRAETPGTFDMDRAFLEAVEGEGLLLRRVNLRRVAGYRAAFPEPALGYRAFREWVMAYQARMVATLVPAGTVMRALWVEMLRGGEALARQVGTYPLTVRLPHPPVSFGGVAEAVVVDHRSRSVLALPAPVAVNRLPIRALGWIKGIGKGTLRRIDASRPLTREGLQAVEGAAPLLSLPLDFA